MNKLRFNIPKFTPWRHPNGLVHLCFQAQQRRYPNGLVDLRFKTQQLWMTVCLDHSMDPLDFEPEDNKTPTCMRCIAGTMPP